MIVTREIFGKKIKDMTKEEKDAYIRYMHKKEYKPHCDGYTTWCIDTFGKRHKDLTPEELREFNRLYQKMRRDKGKEKDENTCKSRVGWKNN